MARTKKVPATPVTDRSSRPRRATAKPICYKESSNLGQSQDQYASQNDIEPKQTQTRKRKATVDAFSIESAPKKQQIAVPAPAASTSAAILQLPAELIHEICLALPFASDAIAIQSTCRGLRNALDNNYFWFKRRRQYVEPDDRWNRWGRYGSTITGTVLKDISEPYNDARDYKALVLKAYRGPGPRGDYTTSAPSDEPLEDGKKKKKTKAETLRCQFCCIQRAYKVWDAFEKAICPACFELHVIDHLEIKKLKKLQLDKYVFQYRRGAGGQAKRHCYWLSDIVKEVTKQYPGETLQSLLNAADQASKDRAADIAAYKQRHQDGIASRILEKWKKDSKYDQYRDILTDDDIKDDAISFAKNQFRGDFKFAKRDKGEDWYAGRVDAFFPWFDGDDDARHVYSMFSIRTKFVQFHLARLKRDYDCGAQAWASNGPGAWQTSTDGKFLVGACHLCYPKAVRKKAEIGSEWSDALLTAEWGSKGLYMTPEYFVEHWIQKHAREMIRKQFGPGRDEYYSFMTGVEGAEPIRVQYVEDIPVLTIP
ncbi:hypothetical protein BJ508DRAFT_372441 [Ascobolus immersus RN42]|uniref:F-box domain-containing protein n=1 Tax=Ascobolus immersus RN42 TaxID=1160509 RepID=A0A3N4IT68_ASCIM|nr:hypothetical protein BJ508DRAFT_372441 [Ascobolus immersus RN42]